MKNKNDGERERERWGEKITKSTVNPVVMFRAGVTERGTLMWIQVEVWLMKTVMDKTSQSSIPSSCRRSKYLHKHTLVKGQVTCLGILVASRMALTMSAPCFLVKQHQRSNIPRRSMCLLFLSLLPLRSLVLWFN